MDSKLIEEARKLGKHKTNKDAVIAALNEYVEYLCRKGILKMMGKVDYYPEYDYKALRRRKRA
ncbi:MAG: type II toxin-antitoxin system VapB family antitoxin [Planctomycetota bacterium]